ncbi:MAG TPA: DUF5703 domain-containing protein, partial [Tepidisphaeraceae bacterium]
MLERLDQYNVVWESPSKDASGSMPLGNGDIGLNVWVEESGDLLLLVAKSDAWDENCSNLKLGRIRLKLSPNPVLPGRPFRQTLNLAKAQIEILASAATTRIWVDANQPVIRIEIDSATPVAVEAKLEMWRTKPYEIKTQTGDIFKNLTGKDLYPTIVSPDHVLSRDNRVIWCHHNEHREQDGYEINMRLQGLGGMIGQMPHPLLGRTFGAAMEGKGFELADSMTLKAAPRQQHELAIVALTAHPVTVEEWKLTLNRQIASSVDGRQEHQRWWEEFWSRSWLFLQSDSPECFNITRAYVLQRFMNACTGRGASPIKHNGSLFTVGKPEDPDFRRWGGPGFWFMNQRLIYWPMLAAGDFDLMLPWLRMYRQQLSLQQHRTQTYFRHAGAHFPETVMFWGAEVSAHYGWIPFEKRARPEAECPYLTFYWSGGIELTLILLSYYDHTGDQQFAREVLLPIADSVTEFFDLHYLRDAEGKIRFEPAQALETWHEAINPLPEIAGLKYTLAHMLSAFTPSPGTPGEGRCGGDAAPRDPHPSPPPEYQGRGLPALRARWERMLLELPPLPIGEKSGTPVILPAQHFDK